MPNKVFYINSEYIKRINKFWDKIYSDNCQLFESFYRFQFTFMYLKKSTFCASQLAQQHSFFTIICCLNPSFTKGGGGGGGGFLA